MNNYTERRTIESKETAKIIRKRLKHEFPGVKFSVRSNFRKINVRYTDGPGSKAVEAITNEYSGGGFDGMIDLDYAVWSWLLPDGTATPAHSSGTEGSRGSVPAFDEPKPHPDAELVQFGAKYIFVSRDTSLEYLEDVALAFTAKYGHQAPPIFGDGSYAYFGQFGSHSFATHQDCMSWDKSLRDMVCSA